MGWDTYLCVGNVTESWRKHAPATVALLFAAETFVSKGNVENAEDDQDFVAKFVSTAGHCRERLSSIGYDLALLAATYRDGRSPEGFASGAFMGSMHASGVDVAVAYEEFKGLSADSDLRAYVELLAGTVCAAEAISVEELPGGSADPLLLTGMPRHDTAYFQGLRAAEFLAGLRHEAPSFGWLFFVRFLLEALPAETEVTFDVAEHVQQMVAGGFIENAAAFPTYYLRESLEALAHEAQLIGRLYGVLAAAPSKVGPDYWAATARVLLARALTPTGTAQERGRLLEDLIEAVVGMDPGFTLLERNLSNEAEEIDLVLSHTLADPFWSSLNSPTVFIECKNWSAPVGAPEARIFESKVRERGSLCRVGVFVAMRGFTEPFKTLLRRLQPGGTVLFFVSGEDLREIVGKRALLSKWLAGAGLLNALRAG